MTMLGAELHELDALATQIDTTQGQIGDVQGSSATATTTVVTDVRAAALSAQTQITNLMADLRSAVDTAAAKAESTTWTGTNRDTFLSSYSSFNSAMLSAETSTSETFESFKTAIESMSAELEDFATSFNGALTEAQSSAGSMATAVRAQSENLATVMNSGMS